MRRDKGNSNIETKKPENIFKCKIKKCEIF